MLSSSCFYNPLYFPSKIAPGPNVVPNRIPSLSIRGTNKEPHRHQIDSTTISTAVLLRTNWSFGRGSKLAARTKISPNYVSYRKGSPIQASWLSNSQIASSVFTLGTATVLPFYTLMVLAPKAELTKKCMESSIPYIVLGVLYAYLLYLSWTPDTIRYMFASKYLLPELSGMVKMFSSEMTLASAWIHLLVVDLFAARHVFHDGMRNQIETRHSVSLCLLFCPIGIFSHFLTKSLTKNPRDTDLG